MAYLLAWVNSGGRLSQPASHLESDFQDGTRFLELLAAEGCVAPEARERLAGAHTLEVFEAVVECMDALGCDYKPQVCCCFLFATTPRGSRALCALPSHRPGLR